jgi:hypothetical protein
MTAYSKLTAQRLPLVGRLDLGVGRKGSNIVGPMSARFVAKRNYTKPEFVFMESSINKKVFLAALKGNRTEVDISIPVTDANKTVPKVVEVGEGLFRMAETFERRHPMTGKLIIKGFTYRFTGWLEEQIPDRLPILICKAKEGGRAKSAYYILLAI